MRYFNSTWINLVSAIVFVMLISFYLSEISEEFFLALAVGTSAEHAPMLGLLGRAFGFFFLILLGVGAVLIPGELLGFIRFYRRDAEKVRDQKLLVQTFLLISVSILSIASITALAMISAQLAG